jgi:light-regulated signal transduction histidine kinase (bacteriophytochrome)
MYLQMKPVEEAQRVFSNRLNLDRYLKHHRRIFQLFQGVHERGSEEGTGLGLAIDSIDCGCCDYWVPDRSSDW